MKLFSHVFANVSVRPPRLTCNPLMTLSNIFGNLFKLFTTVENWLWRLWLFIFLGYTLSKKEMVFVNLKTHFCFDGTEFEEEIPYNFWGSMFDFNKCYSCNIWVIHFQPGILSYHLRALPKGTQGKHSFFHDFGKSKVNILRSWKGWRGP